MDSKTMEDIVVPWSFLELSNLGEILESMELCSSGTLTGLSFFNTGSQAPSSTPAACFGLSTKLYRCQDNSLTLFVFQGNIYTL